ncbi:MAG: hypothetical protein AAGG68_28145 [Bacteroidota bacterium]
MHLPNSKFTKLLLKEFVSDPFEAHEATPAWTFFSEQDWDFQRLEIAGRGQGDFDLPITKEQYTLSPGDRVLYYCYFYMQMHYTSSLYVYMKNQAALVPLLSSNVVFIDFGCGPFTSGAAFWEFCNQAAEDELLSLDYLGIDCSLAMLRRAREIASGIKGASHGMSCQFVNCLSKTNAYLNDIQLYLRGKPLTILINLCYVLASESVDIQQLYNFVRHLEQRFPKAQLLIIHQNPSFDLLNEKWYQLRKLINGFHSIQEEELTFSYQDEVGNRHHRFVRDRSVYTQILAKK